MTTGLQTLPTLTKNFDDLYTWLNLEEFEYVGTLPGGTLTFVKDLPGLEGFRFAVGHNFQAITSSVAKPGQEPLETVYTFSEQNELKRLLANYADWRAENRQQP
ncbi:hypothetical protein [Leptolyngbya sp. FACHB-261]|uniref:hypothetical protein n=1 Tax=Leptolyngbya sp. FACHB-261 TaxID=2692806 RepID=UPI001688395A|nr:hypothetical protein [Leptolyngbya sp. FACHB-261]MBD2099718.1 hypothetical protein [Leptolyngbya sp. FACHB-261]